MLSSPDWKLTFVTSHRVSLQCSTTKYPCSAQPQSIPAVPNRRVSLHCPTAKYPCSAQPLSIPAVPNHQVSLQCPTTKYPCSAQPQSIPGVPNSRVSIFLQRICSAARKTVDRGQGNVIYTSFAITALGCPVIQVITYDLSSKLLSEGYIGDSAGKCYGGYSGRYWGCRLWLILGCRV